MNFLSPWVAVAAAAVVVPALLILYFLKLRRREELVSSTLLWKRAIQDLQVNAPFQRLRKNLLLFLQLLVLGAAIFALARPIVQTSVADEARVVLLIDRSASMNAREGEGTRLEAAKEQAERLVRTFNQRTSGWRSFLTFGAAQSATQVMVIAFSDRATMVSPFTTNTGELVDLIRSIEPTDGASDLREAFDLAAAYLAPPTRLTAEMESGPGATPVSPEIPAKLILLSDGRIQNTESLTLRGGSLELLRVGAAEDNVGVTALRALRNYERPDSVELFLSVQNFGPVPVETDVSLYVDGALRTVRPLRLAAAPRSADAPSPAVPPDGAELPPGPAVQPTTPPAGGADEASRQTLSFQLELDRAAQIEARLARADALPTDNSAYAVVPPPRRQRVLTVTDGRNIFLGTVMAGLPLAEYPFVTPAQFESGAQGPYEVDGQSTYDLVIFDKCVPKRSLPSGNYLFIGALPSVPEIERRGEMQNPALVWWDETHPVLRHVSLYFVHVSDAIQVELPRQAEVLIEGPQGPLLFRYAASGHNYMVLTFAIEHSTWWSKPSFPVFIYNTVQYLAGGGAEAERPLRPGDTLRVPVPADQREVMLSLPDGRSATLRADAGGNAYFGGTDRAGIYRVHPGVTGRDAFAVNLEDPWESQIRPRTEPLVIGGQTVGELAQIRTATPEVWRWFMGAALALLVIEWWVYNRRVMI